MISDTIQKQIGEAMKARDGVRLATLKLLSSALSYERIAKQHELTHEEELVVVKREAKKRKEAIEAYQKAGAEERVKRETAELAVLQEFLPEEMPEAEVKKIVTSVIAEIGAQSLAEMGQVMSEVMKRTKGEADGKMVAEIVRKHL
jgi:uncharacterized protein YqeY